MDTGSSEKQLEYVTRLAHQQEQQIRLLVNLLLDVLRDSPDARNQAENVIFIRTTLYEYIAVEGEEAQAMMAELAEARVQLLKQEERINQLKRRIVTMELDATEVRHDEQKTK